jgi:hypothetical protein
MGRGRGLRSKDAPSKTVLLSACSPCQATVVNFSVALDFCGRNSFPEKWTINSLPSVPKDRLLFINK